MVDLLVSIAVIAILVSLISPALTHVRGAANKVVCASNLRQVGLCISMYRDDNNQLLPLERRTAPRSDSGETDPQLAHTGDNPTAWSGLGWLVADGYISTPQIFYCPAHQGEETADAYSEAWMNLDQPIRTNYAYRGELAQQALLHRAGPQDSGPFNAAASPEHAVLIADAFTSVSDLNHSNGFNTLSSGLSISWLEDENGTIQNLIASYGASGIANDQAWDVLDQRNTPIDTPNQESIYHNQLILPGG